MKLGTYSMAPELISMEHFINPSHQSVCLNAYPPIVVRQRLGKHVPATMKNFWRRRFLFGPCRIKGTWVISSYQNFLFLVNKYRFEYTLSYVVTRRENLFPPSSGRNLLRWIWSQRVIPKVGIYLLLYTGHIPVDRSLDAHCVENRRSHVKGIQFLLTMAAATEAPRHDPEPRPSTSQSVLRGSILMLSSHAFDVTTVPSPQVDNASKFYTHYFFAPSELHFQLYFWNRTE
jgi:hypothetical protein